MKKILTLTLGALVCTNASAQFLYQLSTPDTLKINYKTGTQKKYLSSEVKDIDFTDPKKVTIEDYNGRTEIIYRNTLQDMRFSNRYSNPHTLLTEERFGAYEGLFKANSDYTNGTFFTLSCFASDEMLGGGGLQDYWSKLDYLSRGTEYQVTSFKRNSYEAIRKINELIKKVDMLPAEVDQKVADHTKGEMLFLRAYHHYELASVYENIQVITDNDSWQQKCKSLTPEEIWGQIMLDLRDAISLMDGSLCPSLREDGRVSRYAAEAMLARAFLFYTGFYQGKHDIAREDASVKLPDGSTLTKQQVIDYLAECMSQSPFHLVNDFRNLWPYTNRYTVEANPETAGKGLKWVEDDGAINPEVLFKIRYNTHASWNYEYSPSYSNQYALLFGHRLVDNSEEYQQTFPMGGGWGAGTVAPNLYDDWFEAEPNDMRRQASIQDIKLTDYNLPLHAYDHDQSTWYHDKKISPVIGRRPSTSYSYDGYDYEVFEVWMFFPGEQTGTYNNFQQGSIHPLNLIRFADVLLMHSELTGTTDGINQVRKRAGLQPLDSYSLEALQQERRWELAFEGVRWNDMRRWGDEYCMQALDRQLNQPIIHTGVEEQNRGSLFGCTDYSQQYAQTHGFFKTSDMNQDCALAFEALAGSWTYGSLNGITYGTLNYGSASAQAFIDHQEGMTAGYSIDEMKKQIQAAEGEVSDFAHMEFTGNSILKITAMGDTIACGTFTLHETDNYDWRICQLSVSGDAILGSNGCSEFDIIHLDDQLVLVESGQSSGTAQFWVFRKATPADLLMYNVANKKWSYAVSRSYRYDNYGSHIGYSGSWGFGGWPENSSDYFSVPYLYCAQLDGVLPQDLAARAESWGITDTRDADPYAYMVFNLCDKTISKYTRDHQLITTGAFEWEDLGYDIRLTVHNQATLFPYSFYGEGETVERFTLRYSDWNETPDYNANFLALREDNQTETFTFWTFAQRGIDPEEMPEMLVIDQYDKHNNPAADGCYFDISFKDGRQHNFGYEFTDGTRIIHSAEHPRADIAKGTICQKDLLVWVVNCNNDTVSTTRTLTFKMEAKPASQVIIYDNPEGFTATAWDAAALRFSDNEGRYLPYLTDQQYEELVDNELHFSIKDAADGTTIRVMNGWWAATYYDNLPVATGDDFHFTVTREMADDCSRFGGGKDLDLLVTQGQVTISKVYYEVEQ